MDPVTIYNFEESGEHTVEFVLGIDTLQRGIFNEISMKSIVIPNSVTSIGDSTFRNCRSLTNITIPNSIITISALAFYGCSSLQEITCLATPQTIGSYVFGNISSSGVLKVPAGSNTGLEDLVPEGWIVEYIIYYNFYLIKYEKFISNLDNQRTWLCGPPR